MLDRPTLRFHAGFSAFVAAVVLLPALWSLGSAIHSALSTGQVLVISLGRYETYRTLVPWTAGWARFVAPPLLLVSLLLVGTSAAGERRWWAGATISLLGLVLLFFSAWFVSAGSAAAFVAGNVFIALCFYVDRRFGRGYAFTLMLLSILAAVFWYAPP
jgi:hypothetical protein